MAYAILRVERLKRKADVDNASRHGRRADSGTHYDASRTVLNRHWLGAERVDAPADWAHAVRTAVHKQHLHVRANGAVAAELLLAASPDFFIGDDDEIDGEKLDRWIETNLGWLNHRFPKMVLAARLDLDESSPHLAVLLLPTYEKTTKQKSVRAVSYRKVFCGADKAETSRRMIALQNEYAAVMAPLGLQRGVPKAVTGRKHLTHQQYVARKLREDEARRQALAKAEALARRATEREQLVIEASRRARLMEEAAIRRLREAEAVAQAAEARLQEVEAMLNAEGETLRKLEHSLVRVAAALPDRYGSVALGADLTAIRRASAQTIERARRVTAFTVAKPAIHFDPMESDSTIRPSGPSP